MRTHTDPGDRVIGTAPVLHYWNSTGAGWTFIHVISWLISQHFTTSLQDDWSEFTHSPAGQAPLTCAHIPTQTQSGLVLGKSTRKLVENLRGASWAGRVRTDQQQSLTTPSDPSPAQGVQRKMTSWVCAVTANKVIICSKKCEHTAPVAPGTCCFRLQQESWLCPV